ncbi:MAG: hypothetical protein ABII22_03735 [Candidatus Micrarchaeota archaeon]
MKFSIGKILMIVGVALIIYSFITSPFNIYLDVIAFFLILGGVMTFKKSLDSKKDEK